jgi:hypothetical protein
MKHLTLFAGLLLALPARPSFAEEAREDVPSVECIKERRDYSNTLQTRVDNIEKALGIETVNWWCHFPKGYTVTMRWFQAGIHDPIHTFVVKTDELPRPDGYFLTLCQQKPKSKPVEDRTADDCEVAFDTPTQSMRTHLFYRDTEMISFGSEFKVGKEAELWSITASLSPPPKKYFWATILIEKD